ncbi:hypothetical protein DPEC_G00311110 [Dallia pectoralis]|uniref:Uncharacterized protein n=1 Tax=Dallia pectoralis TaxID=75939 RepID=A0ACC2FB99_DALPE|nr:hypothetical protein DPEC_G00311110 [Dallia pectoralis]
MINEKENIYPNLLYLVRIVLVFPVSTAQVERQFSTIKRMQGDWRLRLNLSTIEDLLFIKSQGCDPLEYTGEKAVERWWRACLRRPGVRLYGSRLNSNPDPESDSLSSDESD